MPSRKQKLLPLKAKKVSKPSSLVQDVRALIEQAQQNVARTANAGLVGLNWQIGKRIHQDILKEERADYGAKIVATIELEPLCGNLGDQGRLGEGFLRGDVSDRKLERAYFAGKNFRHAFRANRDRQEAYIVYQA